MLKELVRRLATWDPDVWMGDDLQRDHLMARVLESRA